MFFKKVGQESRCRILVRASNLYSDRRKTQAQVLRLLVRPSYLVLPPPAPLLTRISLELPAALDDLGSSDVCKGVEWKLQIAGVHFNMHTAKLAPGKHVVMIKTLQDKVLSFSM